MNLRPLGDRMVVKVVKVKEKTESGLFLPNNSKEQPQEAGVIAVGKGKLMDNGEVHPLEMKVGDKVLFAKYSGTSIDMEEDNLLILREGDVLAIIG